ncbi:far upstream element-binding protein 2 [Vitis riparia]|uniref:far upstream element-binding protein 2 n=1 Tax=Vitis riparia TaxID=96939 RepID=UPI00155B05FD|nr:far upstream element-binding protein 2 [Vitis riparia]
MAEEVQYSSGTDATNKRKYEDQTTPSQPSTRRPTGFSAPISTPSPDSSHAPPSYNSVPPPADEIQLAKQRAQEIAARLFSNASNTEAKRPRVENGAGAGGFDSGDKGFSSVPSDVGQKPMISTPSAIPVSYGYQGTSKKIDIPNGRVGVIIGKGGETIKYLQLQSGAKIQVTRDMDADPNSPTRLVELMGTPDQIAKAEQLINDVLSEAEAGGSGIVSRRLTGQAGSEQFVMKVPNNKVGLIIGKGGETIKNMQARTGARIQVIPLHLPPGDTSMERTVQIDGTSEQIESAKQLVNEVISENRIRNPAMAGGYPQQGYQARPPSGWGAPPGAPPMQQPGYSYAQPGSYPGPSPQYNMSQPAYAGYSQPNATGWDQTAAPPSQQTTPGSGYDYYGQQQTQQQQQAHGGPSGPADNSGYNYNQPPASGYNQQGQGYPQDGYGGGYHAPAPQPGYGQPQPIPGYDQQQGYNSATGYGNVANPTQEGHTTSYGAQGETGQAPPSVQPSAIGQQGYNTQQPSPSPASYPPQGSNQPAYGMPPTSQTSFGSQAPAQSGYTTNYGPPQAQKAPANPPVYGQTQQSPSAQGGYAQPAPVQPGYPHSQQPPAQSGYAQTDSSTQRAAPSSYGTAAGQPGYGGPSAYSAPTVTQAGYGQQPPYSGSYGGGYSQPPMYAADATPTSQPAQQSGVAKTSPQS